MRGEERDGAMGDRLTLSHIFIDHSNIWGGARLASTLRTPGKPDISARVSIKWLDDILGGRKTGTSTKIVSGGIPPGMEGVWAEYQKHGYDTQQLIRDDNWKERGVDHTIIGHMWRLVAKYRDVPTRLVLASGDGKQNEFNTSFIEVVREVLKKSDYPNWTLTLASFYWDPAKHRGRKSPTNMRLLDLVKNSTKATFINLFDHYDKVVYHQPWIPNL